MKKKNKLEVYDVEEKKEEVEEMVNILGKMIVGFMLFLCILGITYILFNPFFNKFNPETDVCTYGRYCEEGYSIVGHCTYWFDEAELKDWEMNELKYYKNDVLECKEHRHKNFCEKCLDDWGYKEKDKCADPIGLFSMTCHTWEYKTCESECVCEEYEKETVEQLNTSLYFECCYERRTYVGGDFFSYTILCSNEGICSNAYYNVTQNGKCISAREKKQFKEGDWLIFTNNYTPFEKGHIAYVWKEKVGEDTILVVSQPNGFDRNVDDLGFEESVDFYKPTECEKGNPDYFQEDKIKFPNTATCRKKVLADYSCAELKKQLSIDFYCISKGWITCYADEEVYDAMVDKGCQI